ncbi:MAG: hypothetical protein AAGJ10_01725 [Bacteroidota bacterium]
MGDAVTVFRHLMHPGDRAAGWVFSEWLIRPLSLVFLPIMLFSLSGALQGYRILPYLTFGAPAGIVVAWFWTSFRLGAQVAELRIVGNRVQVRTLWELLRRAPPDAPLPIWDLRREGRSFTFTTGHRTYQFDDDEWVDGRDVFDALIEARRTEPTAP